MGGRIYEPPGTPPSEVDAVLRRKRKKLTAGNNKSTVRTKKIPREFEYHGTPPPLGPEMVAKATSYVKRRGAEDADLLLDMLGLVEPAKAPPKAAFTPMGKRKPRSMAPVEQPA